MIFRLAEMSVTKVMNTRRRHRRAVFFRALAPHCYLIFHKSINYARGRRALIENAHLFIAFVENTCGFLEAESHAEFRSMAFYDK